MRTILLLSLLGLSVSAWAVPPPAVPRDTYAAPAAVLPAAPTIDSKTVEKSRAQTDAQARKIEQERVRVEQERATLEERSDLLDRDQLTQDQLATVHRKEQSLAAQDAAVRAKRKAYRRVLGVLERKLHFLGNQDVPIGEFKSEIRATVATQKDIQKNLRALHDASDTVAQEVASLELDLAARHQLIELQSKSADALQQAISIHEERLAAVKAESAAYLGEIDVLTKAQDVFATYLATLRAQRDVRQHALLMNPGPIDFQPLEIVGLCSVLLSVLVCLRYRRALLAWLPQHVPLQWRWLKFWYRLYFGTAAVLLCAYTALTAAHFHLLALFFGKRLLASGGVLLAGVVVHKIVFQTLQWLIAQGTNNWTHWSAESRRVTLNTLRTLLWTALLCGMTYVIFGVWGSPTEFFERGFAVAQLTFFSLGHVQLSIWVLGKVLMVVWIFTIVWRSVNSILHHRILPRTHLHSSVQYTLMRLARYGVCGVGGLAVLGVIGVDMRALTVVAGTVGIGIGFGLQEIAKNFVSGLILLFDRTVKIGDFIEIDGTSGKVRAINARSTVVDTLDNHSLVIPNAEFMGKRVSNWSYSDTLTRVVIPVGVAYGSDTQLVQRTLLAVATAHDGVLKDPTPVVRFTSFGPSTLDFQLYIWTAHIEQRHAVRSDLHYAIDTAFRTAGIIIPVPQYEVMMKK